MITTSNVMTGTDNTARLLELFGGRLSLADGLEPGRIAGFRRVAQTYGRFIPLSPEQMFESIGPSGTSGHAVQLYRDATEEQRLAIDSLMQSYPSKDTYRALMEALMEDADGSTQGMFNRVVTFYPAISDTAGKQGTALAFQTLIGLDESHEQLDGEELTSCRAVVGLLALCAAGTASTNLSRYLVDTPLTPNISTPTIHVGDGELKTLLPQHLEVVAAHPGKVMMFANAMKASHRMLDADELELVATGDQPVPLVEGML